MIYIVVMVTNDLRVALAAAEVAGKIKMNARDGRAAFADGALDALPSDDLKVALAAADAAGKIQMMSRGGRAAFAVEQKEDGSPVTDIDKQCEERIREIITTSFPRDGFLGEESGANGADAARRWIVDPIDGTRPFIRGIPTHSVLISLEEAGDITVGVIHLPAMGVTCYASKGNGAYLITTDLSTGTRRAARRIEVSRVAKLRGAMGSSLGFLEYADDARGRQLLNFLRSLDYVYGFMDAYSYVLLACGKIDVCVNLLDKPWDCAAAACVITEAGGEYSSISGDRCVHAGSFVATNKLLHEDVLSFFSTPKSEGQNAAR